MVAERTKLISISLTPQEFLEVKEAANFRGLNGSSFVRMVVLEDIRDQDE